APASDAGPEPYPRARRPVRRPGGAAPLPGRYGRREDGHIRWAPVTLIRVCVTVEQRHPSDGRNLSDRTVTIARSPPKVIGTEAAPTATPTSKACRPRRQQNRMS